MKEKGRYYLMVEKLSQRKTDIAMNILSQMYGLVECSEMVQQYLYFGKGCAYMCRCFNEITAAQYHDLLHFLTETVADLNKLICRIVLHEDDLEEGA